MKTRSYRAALRLHHLLLLPLFSSLTFSSAALAANWQQPTQEELKMTAAPDAPGVAGVYLFREEIGDDKLHFHSLYVRLKVLNEEGKKYADVEMPVYQKGHYSIADVEGRTIHSDGAVVPYTGKPIDKLVVKTHDYQYHTMVFTLPDVQVGSILEYRYDLRYDDDFAYEPTWLVQQEIPLRSAHYKFVPTSHMLEVGHGDVVEGRSVYVAKLPDGTAVQYVPSSNFYELRVHDIPANPVEEYMPPMQSLSYRVQFYYSSVQKFEDYWKSEGKYWTKDVDKFANPSKKIQEAVQQIVLPADTPQQKVEKIYDAMMPLENTSFTRQHSTAENQAQGIKIKSAEDIWTQKRGNNDEIALLFIAMVRAAGIKAYAMRVTNRDNELFRVNYMSMYQLEDDIAIVVIDGKEQFLDPGQRYCAFGQMHWKHTYAGGIREIDHGTDLAEAPGLSYKESTVSRTAALTLGPDGRLSGLITVLMSGTDALKWRQLALTSDAEEVRKKFQDELQGSLPPGVEVKTGHFVGLTDWKTVLLAQLDVSGSLGTATSKRVFLPSAFFEAGTRPLFSHEKRELPIDLHFPYQVSDKVTIKLPPGFIAESVPKDIQIPLPKRAIFGVKYKVDAGVYMESRALVLASSFYDVSEYPDLRDFYQKVNAQDQQQLILKAGPPAAGAGQ